MSDFPIGIGDFIPVDKAIEGQFRFTMDGQYAQCSVWAQAPATPDADDLTAMLEALKDVWLNMREELSTSLQLTEVRAYDRTAQVRPVFSLPIIEDTNGVVTGDFFPNNVACCVSFRTGYGHRSGRGRNYVPGIPESRAVGNTWTSPFRSAMADAYLRLLITLPSAGLTWVIASRYHDKAPRPLGVCVPVTNALVDAFVDSQRRRLPGRGR